MSGGGQELGCGCGAGVGCGACVSDGPALSSWHMPNGTKACHPKTCRPFGGFPHARTVHVQLSTWHLDVEHGGPAWVGCGCGVQHAGPGCIPGHAAPWRGRLGSRAGFWWGPVRRGGFRPTFTADFRFRRLNCGKMRGETIQEIKTYELFYSQMTWCLSIKKLYKRKYCVIILIKNTLYFI